MLPMIPPLVLEPPAIVIVGNTIAGTKKIILSSCPNVIITGNVVRTAPVKPDGAEKDDDVAP
jgi:hypothetical protein